MRAFTAGVLTGAALTAAAVLAAPAKSAPIGDAVIAYTAVFGSSLCAALDAHPTFDMVTHIADVIVSDGLTLEQAGQVVFLATTEICPRHRALILDYANDIVGGKPV